MIEQVPPPKPDDGGPAFPFPSGPEPKVDRYHDRSEGMSLRDWFAGQALAGILSCSAVVVVGLPKFALAQDAYEIADAMLKARSR